VRRRRRGEPGQAGMSVVVDRQGELYSLVVDSVREVIEFNDRQLEPNPPTLTAAWREFSTGIYRLQSELLLVLNTERVLVFGGRGGAVEADARSVEAEARQPEGGSRPPCRVDVRQCRGPD